jgi:hypothetical protein
MSVSNPRPALTLRLFAFSLAVLFLLSRQGFAQSTNYTKNTADSTLRGSLQVDPSTLGMSFNLPMGGYGGRGATLPISLTYSSKLWRMDHYLGQPGPSYYLNQIEAKYAEKSVAGWTSSTSVPYIEYTGQEQPYDENVGDPVCTGCIDNNYAGQLYYVARILLHLPDGSTHELRKNDTPGLSSPYSGVFVAVDGSRIKYNFDNSTIYLPDGSSYCSRFAHFLCRFQLWVLLKIKDF